MGHNLHNASPMALMAASSSVRRFWSLGTVLFFVYVVGRGRYTSVFECLRQFKKGGRVEPSKCFSKSSESIDMFSARAIQKSQSLVFNFCKENPYSGIVRHNPFRYYVSGLYGVW